MKLWTSFVKKVKNERGLTLVELLAVVVILGIIAGIAVPSIGAIIDNSKKDAHVANGVQAINSSKLAVVNDTTLQPPNGNITVIPIDYLEDNGYIKTITSPDTNTPYAKGTLTLQRNITQAAYDDLTADGQSYVVIQGTTNGLNYSVYLHGPTGSRNLGNNGTANTPVSEDDLKLPTKRDHVSDTAN